MEEFSAPKALHSEHLLENISPIYASVCYSSFNDESIKRSIDAIEIGAENVTYYPYYSVSSLNSRDKFSKGYLNCTGLVVIGRKKDTQEEISFLTHQHPEVAIDERKRKDFIKNLNKLFEQIVQLCDIGTIDAGIFGGKYTDSRDGSGGIYSYQYSESIKLLNECCKNALHFEPVVITGPNTKIVNDEDATEIYLDTQNRRLMIVMPSYAKDTENKSYSAGDYENAKVNWGDKSAKLMENGDTSDI